MINMLFFMTIVLISGFDMPWYIYAAAAFVWVINKEE